jgi:bacterioferritin
VASPLRVAYDAVMRGDAEIIELLNEILTSELTAINQYFIHYRMLDNQGYKRLAKQKREESIEEMKHADDVIQRILFLDGVPNMQRLFSVRVGEEPVEMHKLDLAVETEQRERLARGIALANTKGDHGTRHLLEEILKNEEESIDWLETQLHLIQELGRERYLAEQMHD